MKRKVSILIIIFVNLFLSCNVENKKDDYLVISEFFKQKKYDIAFEKLKKYKDSDEKYLYLGVYYSQKKDYKQADDSYKNGLEINPENIKICINRSVLLTLQEKYKDAKNRLLECEKIDSKNQIVQFYFILLNDILGETTELIDRLTKIDTSELSGNQYEKLGIICEKNDKKTLAIKFYDYAIIKYREEKNFNSITKLFEKVVRGKQRNSVHLQAN
ncbi:hypothetical protein JXR93_08850 [bacterium]|nr:hypothetical protein [bacterium]